MPTLTFKVSPAEARAIRAKALAEGSSLSDFLRTHVLDARPVRKIIVRKHPVSGLPYDAGGIGGAVVTRDEIKALLAGLPVKYLLDVNTLIAWRHPAAQDHALFHAWAAREKFRTFATCAHAELGFLRVSMQAFGYTAAAAEKAPGEIKHSVGGFVPAAPSPKLPAWSTKTPASASMPPWITR